MNWKIIIPDMPQKQKNVHIEKNLGMFAKLGVTGDYLTNGELLKKDLSRYDAVYMNWFENIDGGAFYMPILRYLRRKVQLWRMKRAGLKVIFCKHNRFPHNPRYRRLSYDLYLSMCKMADVIVSFNDDAQKDLREVFPAYDFSDKLAIIPPLNYIGAYPPRPDSDIYKTAAQYAGRLRIGFIGKISPYKNVELIIRAAEEFADREVQFFISGEPNSPEYKKKLEDMTRDHPNITTMFTLIPDSEMNPALDVLNVLLMPYDTKSASNSGTGRMAFSYGKTVISPDIASMNRIPEELIYKYHYDTPDEHYKKMLEQIERVYADWKRDPESLNEKGRALLKLMETDYSEDAILKKYAEVFQKLREKK